MHYLPATWSIKILKQVFVKFAFFCCHNIQLAQSPSDDKLLKPAREPLKNKLSHQQKEMLYESLFTLKIVFN